MVRLIDANEAIKKAKESDKIVRSSIWETGEVVEFLEGSPTVDAVEVVHGRWLPTNDDNKKRCSRCDVIHLIAQYPNGQANYCPNCGAKMDGGMKRGGREA